MFTNPAYIGAVTVGVSFTVVTTRGGSTPLNATASSTGVSIKGKVGTILASSTAVAPTSMSTSYAATTSGYTQFVGFAPTSIISGTPYWVVMHNDSAGTFNATNFVQWRGNTTGATGYGERNGTAYPPTVVSSPSTKMNLVTYKP